MEYSKEQIIIETRHYFQKVYAWMSLGLMISAVFAMLVAFTDLRNIVIGNKVVFLGFIIIQLVLVFTLSSFYESVTIRTAIGLYLGYCISTGITLSIIFLVYSYDSIALVFGITSAMFIFMSIYGFFTKTDLTNWGDLAIMSLWGVLILIVANLFYRNSVADYFLSGLGLMIFVALTAYDTQKIKKLNIIGNEGTDEDMKEAIIGALDLYLDFVNMFLKLLRLMGKRK